MDLADQKLITGIRTGDLEAFEELYRQYYVYLCLIARHIAGNPSDAEEIVSDVFIRLWKNRERTEITFSIKAYLVKAVYNTSFNYIEQKKAIQTLPDSIDTSDFKLLAWESDYPLGQLYEQDIRNILEHSISSLPEGCREIFLLSRNDNLKYREIALKLGISVNTVKTQLRIALSRLRQDLKDYLP